MKTAEELNTLREEFKTLTAKLAELTEEELSAVTGGNETGTTDEINPRLGCYWGANDGWVRRDDKENG